jgi:hypothetical protein
MGSWFRVGQVIQMRRSRDAAGLIFSFAGRVATTIAAEGLLSFLIDNKFYWLLVVL